MEKEVNDRLDIIVTTSQRANKFLEIVIEFKLFQMTINKSKIYQLLRFTGFIFYIL